MMKRVRSGLWMGVDVLVEEPVLRIVVRVEFERPVEVGNVTLLCRLVVGRVVFAERVDVWSECEVVFCC